MLFLVYIGDVCVFYPNTNYYEAYRIDECNLNNKEVFYFSNDNCTNEIEIFSHK